MSTRHIQQPPRHPDKDAPPKKKNVLAFRTLDDTRELLGRAQPGVKAVVIGGGLLGLEAARGLQVRGCDVSVVHLMSTLMERQLDPDGGNYLTGKMEDLGIRSA